MKMYLVWQLQAHFSGQRLVRDPVSERCSDIGSLSKGSVQIQCQIFQQGEETELGQAYGPWTCSQLYSLEKEYLYLPCALSSTELTYPHIWQLAKLSLRSNLHTFFMSKLSLSIQQTPFYAKLHFLLA